jgi:hypothetical protein
LRAALGQRLFRRGSNGEEEDELLKAVETSASATDWSSDGRFLIYVSTGDLWVLPRFGEGKPYPFAPTTATEGAPVFSPDARWIAYTSDETGQRQVHVRAFPSWGGNYQVSSAGGNHPRWRGDGRELFFLAPDATMMAAEIDTKQRLHASAPRPLFQTGILAQQSDNRPYVVTEDGSRFLVSVVRLPTPRSSGPKKRPCSSRSPTVAK